MARLPEGAELLDDACRMAGYLLRYRGKPIYILPGVPPEMKFLLHDKVLPGLRTLEGERSTPVRQEVYRTCGLREIDINQALHPLEEDRFLQIGYYPVDREVHISLTVRDYLGEEGEARFSRADAFIRKALGPALYGTGEKGLPSVLGEMLSARGFTLCTAESCTGGLLGATITAGPGSSQWFRGGVIAYANTLKESLLGVSPETLSRHGAVSAETARAMARGAAERLGGDLAVAVTGIAGPGGGTTDKPVGTVYLGLWYQGRLSDQLCRFDGNDRRRIQEKTVQEALNMVRCALLS